MNQHSEVNTSSVTLDSTPLIAKAQASRQPLETRRQDTASSFGAALAHTKLHATRHIIYIYIARLIPSFNKKEGARIQHPPVQIAVGISQESAVPWTEHQNEGLF